MNLFCPDPTAGPLVNVLLLGSNRPTVVEKEGTNTTRPSGTGLGLAIVHKFILAHQGDVRLLSDGEEEHSGGAIFEVRLPVSGGEES